MIHAIPLLLALHAPAPLSPLRPPMQPSPAGEWVMEWAGTTGPARFAGDGSYCCLWCGTMWLGRWSMEGSVLTVEEWLPGTHEWETPSLPFRWRARLRPGTLEGTLDSGAGMFRLRKGK